jgi:Neuraminidase (sialidase)
MNSRRFIRWLFVLSVVAQLTAATHAAEEQFPVAPIPGLELTRGETVTNPSTRSPIAFRFKDGRICTYGGRDFSYYSSDGGKTWEKGPLGPLNKMAIDLGNGEILSINGNMIPQKDGKLTVTYQRSTDNGKSFEELKGVADIPLSTSMGTDNESPRVPGMMMHHGIVQLPNGDLLASTYGNYKGDNIPIDAYPVELGCMKTRTVVVTSSDKGKTWGNPITVAYDTMLGALNRPDITGNQFTIVPAVTQEGFNEADLTIAPNGDIICVMRSGGASGEGIMTIFPTPLYMSRSSDNGKTWTPPVGIADRGSNPSIITLENGILVCVYARPGVWVIFSDDNGKTWKGATQVDHGRKYAYIVGTGADSFAVFRVNPENDDSNTRTTFFTVRGKVDQTTPRTSRSE